MGEGGRGAGENCGVQTGWVVRGTGWWVVGWMGVGDEKGERERRMAEAEHRSRRKREEWLEEQMRHKKWELFQMVGQVFDVE